MAASTVKQWYNFDVIDLGSMVSGVLRKSRGGCIAQRIATKAVIPGNCKEPSLGGKEIGTDGKAYNYPVWPFATRG